MKKLLSLFLPWYNIANMRAQNVSEGLWRKLKEKKNALVVARIMYTVLTDQRYNSVSIPIFSF